MSMLGESVTSVGGAFKAALYALAQKTFTDPTTYVCMGEPSTIALSEIVSIGQTDIGQTSATMGTDRGRDETLTCQVTISVSQGGSDDAQPAVTDRAWRLLGQLEARVHYVQSDGTDGTVLGGVVRECFLTSASEDSVPGQVNTSAGRVCVIVGTFTAKARIRWSS